MIRAIRPSAMAQDDASLITGWNVSPNVGYTVVLTPGSSACGALLFDADMQALIASGAGLVGTEQPVVLLPQTGQTIGMVDADLGWHLLLTTTGTESQQTIRIGPAVDLPDEIHPIYTDDNMAISRATAAINAGASYVDDVTVTCPLGLSAGIGDVASAPVDGVAVVGQVESITWTATPDGATTQAVIRRHTAIAPSAPVAPPTPPTVVDDAAETDAVTTTSGNVLANDSGGTLTVSAVNGISSNVGVAVAGNNGGEFIVNADGSWAFDPSGDFASLTGSDTATTSVTYHASDGTSEAMGTLAVTVSSADQQPWTPAEITTALWLDAADSATITLNGSTVSEWRDKSGNGRHATQATASAQPTVLADGTIHGDGNDSLVTTWNLPTSGIDIYVVLRRTANTNTICFGQLSTNRLFAGIASSSTVWFGAGTQNWNNIAYATTIGEYDIFRYRLGSGQAGLDINATVVRAMTAISGTAGGSAFRLFSAGGTGSLYLTGDIAESVIVASDVEVDRIHGYLAHKWGLVSALPSDHPYKSAAPTL